MLLIQEFVRLLPCVSPGDRSGGRGEPWSEEEVAAAVQDYFEMLRAELEGKPYVKANHWRALLPKLNGRSKGAVEQKHMNISAVLQELGYPYINGYKPLKNYQQLLNETVQQQIRRSPWLPRADIRGTRT